MVSLAIMLLAATAQATTTLEAQRQQYLEARKALRSGKISQFKALAENLLTYPLYPYLLHDYLKPRLHKVGDEAIRQFIDAHPDFIATDALKTSWLKQLARQKKWHVFLDNYTPQKDLKLRCQHLQARIEVNRTIYLLEDTRTLWLTGKSLPPECNSAFQRLYQSDLMNDELVWERVRLALENGETGLANYLGRFLQADDRVWLQQWLAMYRTPATKTTHPDYPDHEIPRRILLYGIKHLAKKTINHALNNWPLLQDRYSFTPAECDEVDLIIAVQAAKKKHARATDLLDNLNIAPDDEEIFHWRLKTALRDKDWRKLYQWTQNEPPTIETVRYRWLYWRGRALEELRNEEKARATYAMIAGERDYYGFLAADRLGVSYQMNHHPLPEDRAAKDRVARLPGLQRARELLILYGEQKARAEWHHALRHMTNYQKQIAAAIAAEWHWHDRSIITMGVARAYDDLVLRFPIVYDEVIKRYAAERNLDIGWLFALTRAESAFMEKVKSPAGALGLMQIMPATGKLVAKRIGMKGFRTRDLLNANDNVAIGTAYLKQMRDKFHGNYILATASYNAGPGRSNRWRPKTVCVAPDVWVELIPFDETRKYVKRVLFYASIYDWRLKRQVTPLKQRMVAIHPRHAKVDAQQSVTWAC